MNLCFLWGTPLVHSRIVNVPAQEVNTDRTTNLLKSLEPDILLVCGAPILKPPVFTIARKGTLNIHFGSSPQYQGIHTVFWPLYYHDYEQIGVTLHHIDKGMDTGRVLAYGRPKLRPDDTEGALWASCARVAAKVAAEVLRAAEQGADLDGQQQPAGGRKFFSRDRKIRHDLALQVRRRLGASLPTLPERTETFLVNASDASLNEEVRFLRTAGRPEILAGPTTD